MTTSPESSPFGAQPGPSYGPGPGQPGYQQYNPAGQNYGMGNAPAPMPGAYPANPSAEMAPQRPMEANLGLLLWLTAAVMGIVATVVNMISPSEATKESVRQVLMAQGRPSDDAAVSAVLQLSQIFMIVGFVIAIAIWALFAVKFRQGRNWARIWLTIFGAGGAISGVIQIFIGQQSTAAMIFMLIEAVLLLAAIAVMYLAPVNSYFATARHFNRR